MRNRFGAIIAVAGCLALANWAAAQQKSIAIPGDAKFVVQVDLNAIKHTQLGSMLFDFAKQSAIDEFQGDDGDDGDDAIENFNELLGFDPFEDIQAITLSAADYDAPERSLLAVVRLKETSGNLEGMALGLPSYEASEHNEHQIHSATPNDDFRVYAAIHSDDQQARTLLVSREKNRIEALLDGLDGETVSGHDASKFIAIDTDRSSLVRLQVFDVPMDMIGDGPQANVAKIIKSFVFEVNNADDDLEIDLMMTTENEKQAEQLRQMMQGLIAMVGFAKSMESGEDEMLELANELLAGVQATREGAEVGISFKIDAEKASQVIAKELEIELKVDESKLEEIQRLEELKLEIEAKLEAAKDKLERAN